MRISQERLAAEAEATGFQPETLEKTFQLLGLLGAINTHPFLQGKLALKGGTALNLFVFDVPRLSVDIDLNYVGSETTEDMLRERPLLEESLQAVFAREEFTVRRHAGYRKTPDSFRGVRSNEQEGLAHRFPRRHELRSGGTFNPAHSCASRRRPSSCPTRDLRGETHRRVQDNAIRTHFIQ